MSISYSPMCVPANRKRVSRPKICSCSYPTVITTFQLYSWKITIVTPDGLKHCIVIWGRERTWHWSFHLAPNCSHCRHVHLVHRYINNYWIVSFQDAGRTTNHTLDPFLGYSVDYGLPRGNKKHNVVERLQSLAVALLCVPVCVVRACVRL